MNIQEILKAADDANITLSVSPSDLKEFAMAIVEDLTPKLVIKSEKENITTDLLSQEEVKEQLNVVDSTLWRWHNDNYLCHVKIGRKNFYKKSDIDKIIEKQNGRYNYC